MSNIEPTPFGDKYVLVEHIATGGMAEIYRANYQGIEGFAKELVIKVLRDEFAAREDVVDMFLNEARVAATLTHNNVVHTYDLGELDGEYYIAMELLKGEELVDVLRRAHSVGEGIPLDIACGVVMQSLEGLNYCHDRKGAGGEGLGLVHRDINPTNIHVGYDGLCKILDFGIAATRASALAQEGVAGKLSYMAPEQALAQPIDGRADIFALGVVLYEMCLGQRLFRGPRDEVFRRVTEGDIPAPTFVDQDFPPGMEAIIMKALEVDPADRYQNSDHMFRDLEAFLGEQSLSTSPRRISAFMAELFGEGKPAVMDYEDAYDDLNDDALDFEAYESMVDGSVDAAPAWARGLEGNADDDAGAEKRKARMTIGNLEALVGDLREESGKQTAVPAKKAKPARPPTGPRRSTRRTSGRKKVIPTASQTTKQRRRASGRNSAVRRTPTGLRAVPPGSTGSYGAIDGPAGSTFGHAVVHEKAAGGSMVGWLVALMAVSGLGYFAYTVFTSK